MNTLKVQGVNLIIHYDDNKQFPAWKPVYQNDF